MRRCDVLIVGGGPAGSSCAWSLRRSGLDVIVVDGRRFPRDKVCAGWITPQVLAALAIDPLRYARSRVLQPIVGFRVSMRGAPAVEVDYDRVVSYAVRRCEFDDYLLRRCGAHVELGTPIRRLRRTFGGWIADDRIEARFIVGAGGHFCPVARLLSRRPEPRRVVAREFEIRLDAADRHACATRADLPELLFCRDLEGYGWIVRKGVFVNVGIGRRDKRGLPEAAESFLDDMRRIGRIPAGVRARWKGHAYLTREQVQRPVSGLDALLVGDAAGLAANTSGEGIRAAVESGLLAGDAIERRFRWAETAFGYVDAIRARFGRRGRKRLGPTDLLPARWRSPIAARALSTPWFARNIVLDRWFLNRHTPPLVLPR